MGILDKIRKNFRNYFLSDPSCHINSAKAEVMMKPVLFGVSGRFGSFIARENMAIAFLDEVERPHFVRHRIAIAY